jgi:hypothetical protein
MPDFDPDFAGFDLICFGDAIAVTAKRATNDTASDNEQLTKIRRMSPLIVGMATGRILQHNSILRMPKWHVLFYRRVFRSSAQSSATASLTNTTSLR